MSAKQKPSVEYGALVSIPFDVVGSRREELISSLSITPIKPSVTFGPKELDEDGMPITPLPEVIKQFIVDREARRVFVPWDWANRFLQGLQINKTYTLSSGANVWKAPRLPDPNHPKATKGQAQFFKQVTDAVFSKGVILIKGPTGGGKTVTMLNAIGHLGLNALVIVPSRGLADQWRLEALRHLGLAESEVAIMQGSFLEWKGKKVVIAVIHNLFLKEFTSDFYNHFGTVCWDEAHRLGAPEFSKTMQLFPARYRIAATATPDRKDGCMQLVTNHFGEVCVSMQAEALYAECRVIRYSDPFAHKTAHLPPPILLKLLVKNKTRNGVIVDTAHIAWRRGRRVLILSDRIEHLQTLQKMAIAKGIPEEETGLYVGSYKVKGKTKTTGQAYLRALRESHVISVMFATYSQMKEGTDIPWLDCGIDATPRADGVQAIGRIRRPLPGKPSPVWFTIIDTQIPIFAAYAKARIRDYESSNVKIIDNAP